MVPASKISEFGIADDDVILLADRAFACHDLMAWLKLTDWHYALRLKCDVLNRLYLIAAVALLYATTTGMTVQLSGLRSAVDPNRATWFELS